ncbi:prolipoprotein diacylglyceryl transferase [Mycobacterium sp. MYCO198283]|uniref:prolipoprotein diacylglyceryl transferase n=1 Tax=Mycobacterium sp. MYCO198283 TaxID=2883505 RepID=UPI001E2BAD04|nr:prolipoprotein diacylglyceryl transferase [Mycobacterium sp. MYCO198283]MCG5433496.1 prolipoprotein diacylglyceryl transferase [Mycobacterium sp. MYCO198283]
MILASFPSPPQGVWHLGPFPLRAYALCIIVGIIAALVIGDRRWAARGGERGVIYDIALLAVPFGLVGGRLYHVITDWPKYFGDDGLGFVAALRIWDGGLGIWGAVALGGVGAWIACRSRGIPLPAFGDAVAPGIVLAQAIGRLGNYFNQELYGRDTTLPWGLEIYQRVPDDLNGTSTGALVGVVHPTFLYELLWNLVVFGLLLWADKRFTLGHGRLFALYVAAYCVGRFGIELLRDDAATTIAGIRINSFTSTFVFIGAVVYIMLATKGREDPKTLGGAGDADSTLEHLAKDVTAVAAGTGVVAAATVAAKDEAAGAADAEADGAADAQAQPADGGVDVAEPEAAVTAGMDEPAEAVRDEAVEDGVAEEPAALSSEVAVEAQELAEALDAGEPGDIAAVIAEPAADEVVVPAGADEPAEAARDEEFAADGAAVEDGVAEEPAALSSEVAVEAQELAEALDAGEPGDIAAVIAEPAPDEVVVPPGADEPAEPADQTADVEASAVAAAEIEDVETEDVETSDAAEVDDATPEAEVETEPSAEGVQSEQVVESPVVADAGADDVAEALEASDAAVADDATAEVEAKPEPSAEGVQSEGVVESPVVADAGADDVAEALQASDAAVANDATAEAKAEVETEPEPSAEGVQSEEAVESPVVADAGADDLAEALQASEAAEANDATAEAGTRDGTAAPEAAEVSSTAGDVAQPAPTDSVAADATESPGEVAPTATGDESKAGIVSAKSGSALAGIRGRLRRWRNRS